MSLSSNKLTGQRVSTFFPSGKFCVFEGLAKSVATPSRKFLPLFLATLINKGVSDFKVREFDKNPQESLLIRLKDLGVTTLEIFLGAITKPFEYLAYETRLAEALKRHGDPYLTDAFIDVGKSPDYNSNRDLFSRK